MPATPDAVVDRIRVEREAGRTLAVIADGLNRDDVATAHGGDIALRGGAGAGLSVVGTARGSVLAVKVRCEVRTWRSVQGGLKGPCCYTRIRTPTWRENRTFGPALIDTNSQNN